MEEYNNTPLLRFHEFNDDWIDEELGDIVKINQGLQIPIADRNTTEVEGSHFYITNEFLKEGSAKKYFIKNPPKSVLCDEDDILMTRTGNTGAVVTGVKGAFHNNFFKIAYPNYVNKGFLYLYLTLHRTQDHIRKLAGTSTIPDLNHSDFYKIRMPYPSLGEQQKIATFITAVDDKIQQLSKKKTLLEQYKKGVMQQLFSQKLRFKDDEGKAYPDWEMTEFGDLVDFISTNSLSRSQLNYVDGTIKNIHYGDIHTKFNARFNVSLENVPFINPEIDLSRTHESSYCRLGDLIIADASEDYKDVGKAIEVVATGNQKLLAGLHTYVARDKNDGQIAPSFKAYLMQSPDVRRQIMTFAVGISVLSISKINLGKVKVGLPHFAEQTKIATFISAIDEKIATVGRQIVYARKFKKGLLQQMFI